MSVISILKNDFCTITREESLCIYFVLYDRKKMPFKSIQNTITFLHILQQALTLRHVLGGLNTWSSTPWHTSSAPWHTGHACTQQGEGLRGGKEWGIWRIETTHQIARETCRESYRTCYKHIMHVNSKEIVYMIIKKYYYNFNIKAIWLTGANDSKL